MPYSTSLAARLRDALSHRRSFEEKHMFGGVGFLLHGNMCIGVWKDSLVVRLAPDAAAVALKEPHVKPFDITGRPMKGWLMVAPDGLDTDDQLRAWIDRAIAFVATLPAK